MKAKDTLALITHTCCLTIWTTTTSIGWMVDITADPQADPVEQKSRLIVGDKNHHLNANLLLLVAGREASPENLKESRRGEIMG